MVIALDNTEKMVKRGIGGSKETDGMLAEVDDGKSI